MKGRLYSLTYLTFISSLHVSKICRIILSKRFLFSVNMHKMAINLHLLLFFARYRLQHCYNIVACDILLKNIVLFLSKYNVFGTLREMGVKWQRLQSIY